MDIDDKLLTITAMICLTILECVALFMGIDGQFLSLAVLIISALGGYKVAQMRSG